MKKLASRWFVALALLSLIVVNGLTFKNVHDDSVRERAREQSTAAARAAVTKIFTYSPANMDTYAERALPLTTGKFTDELRSIIATQIEAEAGRMRTSIRTTVEGAATARTTGTESTVLVFADQWRSDRRSKTPVLNAVRLKVTMQATGAGWRVSGIKAF